VELSDLLAGIAVELPEPLIDEIAAAVAPHSNFTERVPVAVARRITQPRARGFAIELCDAWKESPALTGPALAMALRACAGTAHSIRGAQTIELVWTGPQTAVPLRQTREALRDLTKSAKKSLILVSFSAYRDDDITNQLIEACDRGVEVILILETTAHSRGGLDRESRLAFDALAETAEFYSWPLAKRSTGLNSYLHAKTVIADQVAVLLGSANLSGAAMDRNMELGVLIVGDPLPRLLERHVRLLIGDGHLTRLL
jgi:phosphatidylserine/phosphatidylglycerophosphate/cardiolipin synthase-like enzyme